VGVNYEKHLNHRRKQTEKKKIEITDIERLEDKILNMRNEMNTIQKSKVYDFLLDIGTSLTPEKITKHIIPFPSSVKMRSLDYNQFVLQITPFLDNKYHHLSAYFSINYFEIKDNSLEVHILTTTTKIDIFGRGGWLIKLEAFLSVTILNTPITLCPRI
jgi:hypothetical protein